MRAEIDPAATADGQRIAKGFAAQSKDRIGVKRKDRFYPDFAERLDAFLQFSAHDMLYNAGKAGAEAAKALAMQDREYPSDFDRETAQLKELASERKNEKK